MHTALTPFSEEGRDSRLQSESQPSIKITTSASLQDWLWHSLLRIQKFAQNLIDI